MRSARKIPSMISRNGRLTDFEKSVLLAVLTIPEGEVRGYGWVAKAVGRPKACRAVGNALNKNPYAPAVPCHRVIRSDGSIGGFAKGSALKARRLKKEGVDLSTGSRSSPF